MTKKEAIILMQQGVKITHIYFSKEEWVTMEDGMILLEDGVRCEQVEFWKWRTSDFWNEGYSEWEN